MNKLLQHYLKSAFRWQDGRQSGGYQKMLLLWSMIPLPFDIYIIKYNKGSYITPHTDPVTVGKHYRLNIVLKKSQIGGEFICKNPIYSSSRIKLFRPDMCEHSVTKVEKGTRYLLSIGWILK